MSQPLPFFRSLFIPARLLFQKYSAVPSVMSAGMRDDLPARLIHNLQDHSFDLGGDFLQTRGRTERNHGRGTHCADKSLCALGVDGDGTRQHESYVDVLIQGLADVARIADFDDLQRTPRVALFRQGGRHIVGIDHAEVFLNNLFFNGLDGRVERLVGVDSVKKALHRRDEQGSPSLHRVTHPPSSRPIVGGRLLNKATASVVSAWPWVAVSESNHAYLCGQSRWVMSSGSFASTEPRRVCSHRAVCPAVRACLACSEGTAWTRTAIN